MAKADQIPLPRWFAADKRPGQYSRRHDTSEANIAARRRYKSEHGPLARRAKAALRREGAA